MSGYCPHCGKTYKPHEFPMDWLGRIGEPRHRCIPADIARFVAQHAAYGKAATHKVCLDCEEEFIGTESSLRCRPCAKEKKREQERAARENLAKAREHRCCECKRPATKASDRCRFHQHQLRIKNGIGRRVDRLVQDDEAA